MRLDFNALWVDDQPDGIRSYSERIGIGMRAQGFEFKATIVRSVDEAKSHVANSVYSDNIDLVLVDFTLGGGPHGNVALREVRQQLPYREIIFYSANPAMDLQQKAHEEGVQGVYCANREELVDTALGVFETLIKKALDLDHARGIVLGATSDIDHLVHDVLLAIHGNLDANAQAAMREDIQTRIDEKLAALQDSAALAKEAGDLEDLFELQEIVTAFDRLRILVRALKAGQIQDKTIRDKVIAYMEKVVPDRNLLGHVSVSIDEAGSRVLRGRSGKSLTEQRLHELRRELLDHRENFRALAVLFGLEI